MAPEVFFTVCYGTKSPPQAIQSLHTFTPVILEDFCRHRVESADYPGIIAEKGQSVRGIHATGLTSANWVRLDQFEGSEYERVRVNVKPIPCKDDEQIKQDTIPTNTYVFLYPDGLERGEWDFEHFRRERMQVWAV